MPISVPYTEAFAGSNLPHTVRKFITFGGTKKEDEKVSPVHRQTV